ncbi:MAG TPA: TonB-dependent siderophore receptor [Methylophaga aminisulfidivorans]|uniref:TonB-dependent siderophore receptor n=2 Tax=root TaxID=1 RepID=A0A7C1ZVJ6_9GAMM|nr:TonB-dependent siderophore receptor [Methylophaga aminisulfidivorans]
MRRSHISLSIILAGLSAPIYADSDISSSSKELAPLVVTGDKSKAVGIDLDTPTEVGSRLGLSMRENPASVAIADRALMDQIGARDFQDAVNALPGVNASAPPGWGGNVSYRGFNGSQINQLFNGISLAYSSANRPVGAWIYDHVELIGGPSSFLYGTSSVGGSVNYVTKVAERTDQQIDGRLGYGRYDTMESSIGVNKALNDSNWIRFDYSHTGSNGYIDRQENHADNMAFSWLADITDNLSHTLALEYLEEKEDSPYWGSPTLQPQSGTLNIDKHNRFENYNVDDGRYEQRVRWLRSITDYQFNEKTALKNTFYHYDGQRDYRNLEKYTYSNNNSAIDRAGAYQQRHDQELNGNRIELTYKGELFDRQSDWAMGLDYSINQQTIYPTSISSVFDTVTPANFAADDFYDISGMGALQKGRSNKVKTFSVFAENRQELTTRLALISALRFDHIDFRHTPAPGATDITRNFDTFTGRLGLVFDVTENVSLYTQFSTSAEPPGGTLTSARGSQVQDFDISRGRQIEVGTKFNYLDERGTATIAAYQIVRKDISVSSPTNPNQTVQAGQQTSTGLELATSFQITPLLRTEANAAFVRAKFDEFSNSSGNYDGKRPHNIPNRLANVWMIYEPTTHWETGVGARYVSSVYQNYSNTLKVPSYTLYDAYLKYRVNQNVDVTLRGRNLSDKLYATFIHQSNAQYYVGEPRSVELTVDFKY